MEALAPSPSSMHYHTSSDVKLFTLYVYWVPKSLAGTEQNRLGVRPRGRLLIFCELRFVRYYAAISFSYDDSSKFPVGGQMTLVKMSCSLRGRMHERDRERKRTIMGKQNELSVATVMLLRLNKTTRDSSAICSSTFAIISKWSTPCAQQMEAKGTFFMCSIHWCYVDTIDTHSIHIYIIRLWDILFN